MSSMTLAMLLTLKDLASGPLGEFQGKLQKTSQNLMAIGSTAMETGKKILGMLNAPVAAFEEAEDAALRLDAAMMGANKQSHALFPAMKKHAVELGNELPGTARELQMMFAALIKEGVTAEDILHGVGRATGSLAVITGMGFSETAKFAGQISNSIGIAAKDMMPFMDTIQRAFHLGLSPTEIGYAFDKAAGAFNKFKMKGLEAANDLVPVLSTLIKAGGMSAETAGTNFVAYMNGLYEFQTGTDKSTKKLRASLKSLGVDFDLFEKDRTFKGTDKMMAMLDKIRTLDVNVQNAFAKELFGSGSDSAIFEVLSATGSKGIDAMDARMKKQADLTARITKILSSFKNIKESAMGAFETLLAGVGEAIGPELKAVADGFGALSEKILVFTQAHPQLTKILTLLTIFSGVSLVVGGGLIFGLGVLLNMVATISGVMPIAVTFLSTKFMHLFSTFLKIGAWNASAGARLTAWVTGLPGKIGGAFSRLGAWFLGFPARFAAMFAKMRLGVGAFGGRIISAFGSIGRAFVGFPGAILRFFTGLPGLLMRIPSLLSLVAGGLKAMALASLGNPIVWIIAAIVLGAVLIYKYWKPIKGFFIGLWQGLKSGLAPLAPAFKSAFKPWMPLIRPIIGMLKGVWNWIKNLLKPVDDVGNKSQNMGKRFGQAIAGMILKGAELVAKFSQKVAAFVGVGRQLVNGLKQGFSEAWAGLKQWVGTKAGELTSIVKSTFGINSPSRVFAGIGKGLGQGLQLGMESTTGTLNKAALKMTKAATPELPKLATIKTSGSSLPAVATASASLGPGGQGGGTQITFAPNISLSPGSPAAQQVQEVMPLLYDEFKRMIRQYERDNQRSFA